MPERKATIKLREEDIQLLEQAVLDDDNQSAMQFVREVLKPRVDEVLHRPHCRPVFEWETGEELRPTGPPDESSAT